MIGGGGVKLSIKRDILIQYTIQIEKKKTVCVTFPLTFMYPNKF